MARYSDGRLSEIFAAIPSAMRAEVQAELDAQAGVLMRAMRFSAAKGKTLNLANSIRAERTRGRQLSVTVKAGGAMTTKPVRKGQSAKYDYALATEHGTKKERKRPFFYPTYRSKKKAIGSAVMKKAKAGLAAVVKIDG